jgi:hypothetical protein
MLYHCEKCGAVYYLGAGVLPPHCEGSTWVKVEFSARAFEYSEAGGTITGIDVTVTVD